MRWRRQLGAVPLVAVLALIACGGEGERVFSLDEFVDEVNAEGAGLEVGTVITTSESGVEIHEVALSGETPSPTGSVRDAGDGGDPGNDHGAGAILVLDDEEQATSELERCESAPAFTCFRAANVVLRFEESFPEEQARGSVALQALATD